MEAKRSKHQQLTATWRVPRKDTLCLPRCVVPIAHAPAALASSAHCMRPGSAWAGCNRLRTAHALAASAPVSTRCGTSAASQGARPRHMACATPKCGLRAQSKSGVNPDTE